MVSTKRASPARSSPAATIERNRSTYQSEWFGLRWVVSIHRLGSIMRTSSRISGTLRHPAHRDIADLQRNRAHSGEKSSIRAEIWWGGVGCFPADRFGGRARSHRSGCTGSGPRPSRAGNRPHRPARRGGAGGTPRCHRAPPVDRLERVRVHQMHVLVERGRVPRWSVRRSPPAHLVLLVVGHPTALRTRDGRPGPDPLQRGAAAAPPHVCAPVDPRGGVASGPSRVFQSGDQCRLRRSVPRAVAGVPRGQRPDASHVRTQFDPCVAGARLVARGPAADRGPSGRTGRTRPCHRRVDCGTHPRPGDPAGGHRGLSRTRSSRRSAVTGTSASTPNCSPTG